MKIFTILDKIILFFCKLVTGVIFVFSSLVIVLFLFLFASEWLWPEINGSYDLGNNIYMMEWDGGGRIIVYGTNISGNTCYGGGYLIPTYENQYDSTGRYAEYVVDAKSDDNWVIVRSANWNVNERKYYIISKNFDPDTINKDKIINTKIEEFTDSSEFSKRCYDNGITMGW